MEIEFRVSYPTSLFRFVDNLSDWSPHTSREVKDRYEEKLSEEQKELLKTYAEIRKHGNGWRSRLQIGFCRSEKFEEALGILEEAVPEKGKELENVFRSLKPLHDEVISPKRKKLLTKKEELEKVWEDIGKDPLEEIEETLDLKWKVNKVKIYMYYTGAKSSGGGGANMGQGEVTIALSRKDLKKKFNAKRGICVLLHELCHVIQREQQRDIREMLKERYNIHGKQAGSIEEAIMDCLAPRGFLTNELLGSEITKGKSALKSKEYEKYVSDGMIARDAYQKLVFPIVEDYYYHKDERNFWLDCLPKIVDKVVDGKERMKRLPLKALKKSL